MLYLNSIQEWLVDFGLTAPWLQAWGSIGALSVAIMLAFFNQKQVRNREVAKQAQYMEAIACINEEAVCAASEISHGMNSDALHHHGVAIENLGRCLQTLDSISLESLPNAKGYMAIYQMRKNLHSIHNVAFPLLGNSKIATCFAQETLDDAEEDLNQARKAVDDFAEALSSLK